MGLHGWHRTGARLTARSHAVKLYRARSNDGSASSTSSVTVDWPVEHWLYAWVRESTNPRDGWWWGIRDSRNRRLALGQVKKEAGARRAVVTRIEKLSEEIRQRVEVAELERAKVDPLLARGYAFEPMKAAVEEARAQRGVAIQRDGAYKEVEVSTEEQARKVLSDGLAGLDAMRAGAAKAGVKL